MTQIESLIQQWSSDRRSCGSSEWDVQLPLNVLKFLASAIRDYICQLSPVAPHWMTESNLCKQREPSAPIVFYLVKQVKERLSITNE